MRDWFQSTASQPDSYARLKEGQGWLWSLGDYDEMARRLQPCADALVDACGIAQGTHLLDVGAGTGNLAIAAARRGAAVVASDLSPRMVELGRARSAAQNPAIEWRGGGPGGPPVRGRPVAAVPPPLAAGFAPPP